MIELKSLSARYGRVGVLREVSLHVEPGAVLAVLGANGAGKTTLLHSIAGVHRAITGEITFEGKDITGLDTAERTRRGISLVPAGRQVFAELTVEQNLQIGLHGTRLGVGERAERFEQVLGMFPVLGDFASRPAGLLSGGQQQMLAIARALVRRPAYLLLDEPSLGLAPQIVEQILGVLSTLTESGVGVLLAEQNAGAALGVSQRGVIIENGLVVRSDTSDVLLNDPEVSNHYLGVEQEAVEVVDRAVLPTSIFEPID